MLNKVFNLKNTIDIFVTETESPNKVLLTFHKMTTRTRIELIVGKSVAEFLALLDGLKTVKSILKELGNFNETEALSLITFLQEQHLIVDNCESNEVSPRFSRQIAYFDDMILDRSGSDTQTKLASKKIVILGCGSVGAAIAETLVRAGISKLSLVDYKIITESCMDRHLFTRLDHIGLSKVEVLADYLRSIDTSVKIKTYQEHLLPKTDLSKWIQNDTDLIINSCDEPYIGHIALKIGRYAQTKNIPLYIAGGFDAHLMSSGELVYPPHTPCIDCAQQTFTKALGNWNLRSTPLKLTTIIPLSIFLTIPFPKDLWSNLAPAPTFDKSTDSSVPALFSHSDIFGIISVSFCAWEIVLEAFGAFDVFNCVSALLIYVFSNSRAIMSPPVKTRN